MSATAIAIDDVFEVKLYSYCRDQLGLNVLHYVCTQAPANPPANTIGILATAVDAKFAVPMKGAMSSEASYEGASLRFLGPGLQSMEFVETTGAGVGTTAGDVLPTQVSGIITKRTLRPGRAFRGRMYIPFPSETNSDTKALPTAAYLAKLATISTALLQVISDGVAPIPVELSLIVGKGISAANTRLVLSTTNNRKFATQRRRGSYGKANVLPF